MRFRQDVRKGENPEPLLRVLSVGVAIYREPRAAQPVDAIAIDVALPGEKLIDRDVVDLAYVLDRPPPATDGLDNNRLAPCRPPLAGRRQLGYRSGIGPVVVLLSRLSRDRCDQIGHVAHGERLNDGPLKEALS